MCVCNHGVVYASVMIIPLFFKTTIVEKAMQDWRDNYVLFVT